MYGMYLDEAASSLAGVDHGGFSALPYSLQAADGEPVVQCSCIMENSVL